MLCLTLDGRTMKENSAIFKRHKACVSMLELRLDMLNLSDNSELLAAKNFPGFAGMPVILTIRRNFDGGRFHGSEDERKTLLREFSRCGFSYVDLEVDLNFPSLEYELMEAGVQIIRSIHDFKGMPDVRDLQELAKAISSCGEIPKFAVTPKSVQDQLKLVKLSLRLDGIRKIIIGMGIYGLPLRILYRRLGSLLTFCSENDPNRIGLPSPEDLHFVYRSDSLTENSLTENTKLIALPIFNTSSCGSFTPAARRGDSACIPFHLSDTAEDRKAFAELCALLGVSAV